MQWRGGVQRSSRDGSLRALRAASEAEARGAAHRIYL